MGFHLLIIAGHGAGDSGASSNGYREADLNRELAKLVQKAADSAGINCRMADENRNYFQYLKNGGSLDLAGISYVLEIHFNFSNQMDHKGDGKIKGSMMYISQSETGHSVEDAILSELYKLGSKQVWGGVVVSQRQWSAGLLVQEYCRTRGVSHGLLETCFISDADDMSWYQSHKLQIAEGIIRGIVKGFGLQQYRTHKVAVGQTLWQIATKYLGSGHRWTEIQRLNGLPDTEIRPGQILQIPDQ